jgi:AcrR family transcriptional regulator
LALANPSQPTDSGQVGNPEKAARILDAAQSLFLRYGVKRTSMDDVAREAGIAKGTLYLYYSSKDSLFSAVAENVCATILARGREAIGSPASTAHRLVGLLDALVGSMHRLTEQSPHVAELRESKIAHAIEIFSAFDRQRKELVRGFLVESGIADEGAVEMFLAAAMGATMVGDTAEVPYRARLTTLVDTLIAGLATGLNANPPL